MSVTGNLRGHRGSRKAVQSVIAPGPPLSLHPKPTPPEEKGMKVYGAGAKNTRWSPFWIFNRMDNGAFRVKFHSDYDGIVFTIALRSPGGAAVHPYIITVDHRGYSSVVHHIDRPLAEYRGPVFTRRMPQWLWVRFNHGNVEVGAGKVFGENAFMQGQTIDPRGGGYGNFGIGRTGNSGAFELLDVQPMELRQNRNRFN